MVKVKLRDDVREFESGISALEIAQSIGAGLYKAVCVCKIDGEVKDLRTNVETGNVDAVLREGDLDPFVVAYHRWNVGGRAPSAE